MKENEMEHSAVTKAKKKNKATVATKPTNNIAK